jgi:predicted DNA-binding transcriptional regulator AlpA
VPAKTHNAGDRKMSTDQTARTDKLLLSDLDVEALTGFDARTVRRRADDGTMPAGVKIGGLRRWRRDEIEAWVRDGCPRVRPLTQKRTEVIS